MSRTQKDDTCPLLNQHVSHHPKNNASLQIENHIFGVFGVDGTVVRFFDLYLFIISSVDPVLCSRQLATRHCPSGGRWQGNEVGGRTWGEHTAIEGEERWGDYSTITGTSRYACEKKQLHTTTPLSLIIHDLLTSLFCVLSAEAYACMRCSSRTPLSTAVCMCIYVCTSIATYIRKQHTRFDEPPVLHASLYIHTLCVYSGRQVVARQASALMMMVLKKRRLVGKKGKVGGRETKAEEEE